MGPSSPLLHYLPYTQATYVVPDLLHILPVVNNAVLQGILQRQNTTLRLCLVAYVGALQAKAHGDQERVLLAPPEMLAPPYLSEHVGHDAVKARAPYDGGKDCLGRIVARKAGLAAATADVDDNGLHFVAKVHLCVRFWVLLQYYQFLSFRWRCYQVLMRCVSQSGTVLFLGFLHPSEKRMEAFLNSSMGLGFCRFGGGAVRR